MHDMERDFRRHAKIQPEGHDPVRRKERRDFNMINEDLHAIGNLPTKAQHHEWPKDGGYFFMVLD